MRATRQRPVSQPGVQPQVQSTTLSSRKIFNCIVDDTALVAGVKKSTRNGIRQWVKNGQMRLFVPLHALEQLRRQAVSQNRHGEDVRETLQWLDDATSRFPHAVTLQGGDQYYQNWAEVEGFAVPRTLFSETDHVDEQEPEPEMEMEMDALPEDLATKATLSDNVRRSSVSSAGSFASQPASPSSLQSMRSSVSPVSPPTSPTKADSLPAEPLFSLNNTAQPATSSSSVPFKLQSLFNYILWRIHQELDPAAALESFIFLCNDANKAKFAKGFDVRTKRLEQLREAVGREDRDFRNRQQMQTRVTYNTATNFSPHVLPNAGDEVEYQPKVPRGPAAMMRKQQPNVIDPNEFGRTTPAVTQPAPFNQQPKSPHFQQVYPQSQNARGGPALPIAPRGNGRGNFRGGPRGRASFTPGRAPFGQINNVPLAEPNSQIDPDSFVRPRGSSHTGRGGRKLWMPT